jgi:hypothetical protein
MHVPAVDGRKCIPYMSVDESFNAPVGLYKGYGSKKESDQHRGGRENPEKAGKTKGRERMKVYLTKKEKGKTMELTSCWDQTGE